MSTICKSETFGHVSTRHSAMWFLPSFPRRVGGLLRKNDLSATGFFALSKYQRWYDALMVKARCREIPACYTENHHVIPRSMGGSDCPLNLVRLTYREHFVAHWLLIKFHSGLDLQKMQFAIFAMSLQANGQRIVSSWQFEVVKRAVADMKEATSKRNQVPSGLPDARRLFKEHNSIGAAKKQRELDRLAFEFLAQHPKAIPKQSRRR